MVASAMGEARGGGAISIWGGERVITNYSFSAHTRLAAHMAKLEG